MSQMWKMIIKWQTRLLDGTETVKHRKGEIMMKYRYIIGHEWEVVECLSQYGVGDLLFTDSKGKYLVMEVKEL